MKTLGKAMVDRAVSYLKHDARALERAMYAYHFEGGAADNVLTELANFQNGDGGFGHGLEADIRLADSSVIATMLAFQRFRELHTPADYPMVVKACGYLRDTYDAQPINWPIIPPNIDDAPHAPWWVRGDDLEKSMANPRTEIAGYLHDYPQHFPDDMRNTVTESVVAHLLGADNAMEMHDLMCYVRLSDTGSLPADTKATLLEKLTQVMDQTVEPDPAQWRGYGLPPLGAIASPESPFAGAFAEAIQHNLDFVIETQNDDGTWTPPWSWPGEAWAQARRDWTGVLTLDNLRKLRAFGRLAI